MPIRLDAYAGCSFCRYVAHEEPCAFVAEDDLVAAFVDRAQFERGAMLVIPRRHRETILDMDDPELGTIIHPAGWVVLHHCDAADHDFHPQDSDAGTPGAILVTRVDLELNYGVFPA